MLPYALYELIANEAVAQAQLAADASRVNSELAAIANSERAESWTSALTRLWSRLSCRDETETAAPQVARPTAHAR